MSNNIPVPSGDEGFRSYMGINATREYFCGVVDFILKSLLVENGGSYHLTLPGVNYSSDDPCPWRCVNPSSKKMYSGFQICKKHWVTNKNIDECDSTDTNYFVHLEFKWNEGDDVIRWSVHYETYPYRTFNEVNALQRSVQDNFYRQRETFSRTLHSELQVHRLAWKPKNRDDQWQRAVCEFSADSTITQLKNWLESQTHAIENAVDRAIESVLQ